MVAKGADVLGALGPIARCRRVAERTEQLRHRRVVVGHGLRGRHGLEDLHDVLAVVTGAAREDLVQRGAEQVHVGALVEGRPEEHLGRHVRGRTGDPVGRRRPRERRRDPPVDEVDLAVAPDHHVLGLDVAMEDAAAVRELDRSTHVREDAEVRGEPIHVRREDGPERVLRVAEERRPVDALDALHHEQRTAAVVDAERVHRDDAGMLERSGEPCLAKEPRTGRGGGVLLQRLHRHVAIERTLAREVDAAHPAFADGPEDREVRPGMRLARGELLREIDRDARKRMLAGRRSDGVLVRDATDRLAGRERLRDAEQRDAFVETAPGG